MDKFFCSCTLILLIYCEIYKISTLQYVKSQTKNPYRIGALNIDHCSKRGTFFNLYLLMFYRYGATQVQVRTGSRQQGHNGSAGETLPGPGHQHQPHQLDQ